MFCNGCINIHLHSEITTPLATFIDAEHNNTKRTLPQQLIPGHQNLAQLAHSSSNPPGLVRRYPTYQLPPSVLTIIHALVASALDGTLTPSPPPATCQQHQLISGFPFAPSCPMCKSPLGFRGCGHSTRGAPLPFDCLSSDLLPCARIPPTSPNALPYVCDVCVLARVRSLVQYAAHSVLVSYNEDGTRCQMSVDGMNPAAAMKQLANVCDQALGEEWRIKDRTRASWGRWVYYHGQFRERG
jgi:hypothetical protein